MKKLLFTGASGFLGYNILPILHKEYETVHTMGLGQEDDIKINLAKEVPPINTHYEIVLHACGKAHVVPRTQEEEKAFYDVNYEALAKSLDPSGEHKLLYTELPKFEVVINNVDEENENNANFIFTFSAENEKNE